VQRIAIKSQSWIAASIIAVALSVGLDVASAQPKPVSVGFLAALTGPLSAFDSVTYSSVKLSIDQINAAGGIDGRKLELKVVDYASVPANAVPLGNQLINQGVDVLIGGSGSAANSALLPLASRNKIPMLAISNLTGDVTWAFFAPPPYENNIAKAQIEGFKTVVKGDSLAIMAFSSPAGQANAKEMERSATAQGIKVVSMISIDPAVTDVSSEMLRIKESGAKALLTFAGGPSNIIMAKNAASVGLQIPIFYSIETKERVIQAMAQYPNIYTAGLIYYSYPDIADPEIKPVCDKLIPELAKVNPEHVYSVAGFGSDFLNMYVIAAKASGATTGEKLRAAMEKVTYTGCANRYKFSASDHSGQLAGPDPFVMGQWQKDGTYKTIWRDK
jgi:branched-chain amino acid transport system substrate-binding protein